MKLKKRIPVVSSIRIASFAVRTCQRCHYHGGGWKDDDQCPKCGEVN